MHRLGIDTFVLIFAFALLGPQTLGAAPAPISLNPGPAQESLSEGVQSDWWSAVQQDIARSEYRITDAHDANDWTPGAAKTYQAANRAQNFRTHFTPEGIRVVPRTAHRVESPAWEWGLTLVGWGRDGAVSLPPAPPSLATEGNRIELRREGLVEWYMNDARGLEQGFTIERRPEAEGAVRVNMLVTGNVAPVISDQGQVVDFLAEGGARTIRFDCLRAVDAHGRALSAWFEFPSRDCDALMLSIVVDDLGADYPITIDPLATNPSWTVDGDQADTGLGQVATAGDVNGDGYSDVIVGAYLYDHGETDEGKVFVYLGSPAGLATSAAWTAESNQAGANFGIRVATAGDVNGDGFSDVMVGAWLHDHPQSNEGSVFVWYGSAAGLGDPGTPDNAGWRAESDQPDANLGIAIAPLGDVNGDGYGDVAVGSWTYEDSPAEEGRVFVWYGSSTGLVSNGTPANADWFAESDRNGARLGYAVAPAGDVNGDGYNDLIAGALYFEGGQTEEGSAFVWHGGPGGLGVPGTPANADWSAQSDQVGGLLGNSVSTAGDVNGDGYGDVIVGVTGYEQGEGGETDEGWVLVWYGSAAGLGDAGTPGNADWSAQTNEAGAGFSGVTCAGDVNGDGYADVLVGSSRYGSNDEGRVFVWYGGQDGLGPLGLPGNADWSVQGDQASAHLGLVATAGDINGDGMSDVILGASDYGQNNEGRAFVYNGSAAGLSLSSLWTTESDQDGASFGSSVASAGDVNGDGYSDVIVGAGSYDSGEQDEGAAFVYYGSPSGLSTSIAWSAQGNWLGAAFGSSVATAGDVNGDGFSDVVIGAPLYDNWKGQVVVYHGSTGGLGQSPAWSLVGTTTSQLGASVATAGDVNGDGLSDVIVGAPLFTDVHGEQQEGKVSVYHGTPNGLGASAAWSAVGVQSGCDFGRCVNTAGDVNGDGYSDIVIGAPSRDNVYPNEGRVYVYKGSSTGLGGYPAWFLDGEMEQAAFGQSVSTAGDVNGDGYSDVLIGSGQRSLQGIPGRASVFHGSAIGLDPSPTPDWFAESDHGGNFGAHAAAAGDVNGDGYSDVIVSASTYNAARGRVYAYYGSATGLTPASQWMVEGDQTSCLLGSSVSSAGDVNGDGFNDVIVGAVLYDNGQNNEGRAFLYYGNGGPGRTCLMQQQRTDGVTPIEMLGRSDSETEFRIRASAPSIYGRTRLQIVDEVKPRGTLLDGLNTLASGFIDTGSDGQIDFNTLVGGLAPGTQYHWRARVEYDPVLTPFQRHGAWTHRPLNGWNEADLRTGLLAAHVEGDESSGLTSAFELRDAGPNPGRGSCHVLLALLRESRVDADVIDANGRSIALLVHHETYAPGSHVIMWDGSDRSGAAVPGGVYFLRFRSAGETRVHKVVLIR